MKLRTLALTLALASASICCWALTASPSPNLDWRDGASSQAVDQRFAEAKSSAKPLLLYWGATWCPPCNQLKATLFNRQDFANLARQFVAVHVDGDKPAAQRLGERFKVSGYPTVVLFSPTGTEVTRLPGEVDPEQLLAVMQLALAGGRPVKSVLADAQAGRTLTANEWRMLAFYSWETDEGRTVPKGQVADTLSQLALASPAADREISNRLWLKALAASDDGKGIKADAALRRRVLDVLADSTQVRAHMDVIGNAAADLVKVLADDVADDRTTLMAAFDTALRRLQADTTLSRADRLAALVSRIELARMPEPKSATQVKLPEALLAEVRQTSDRLDREVSDPYERQAVIPYAAHALALAGLWADSEALLKSNLAKSHSPYYLMSQLGSNARKLGRTDEALRWYEEAFRTSQGPATRLQWGAGYLAALVDLAPAQSVRIEKTAAQLISEAGRDQGAFYERSGRSMKRVGAKLAAWNQSGQHAAVLKRLKAQLDGVCRRMDAADPQRTSCRNVFAPAKPAA